MPRHEELESFELSNNFVVKMEDKNGDKNACLYRKTGVGKSINTKEQKAGIQVTLSVSICINNYSVAQNIPQDYGKIPKSTNTI